MTAVRRPAEASHNAPRSALPLATMAALFAASPMPDDEIVNGPLKIVFLVTEVRARRAIWDKLSAEVRDFTKRSHA
jgi:hypothetical protein